MVWVVIFIVLAVLFAAFQFDVAFMLQWAPFILAGVGLTILISVLGIALSIPLALLGALGRLSGNPIYNGVSGFYVSFIRGTPLLVQIFFIYLGSPAARPVRARTAAGALYPRNGHLRGAGPWDQLRGIHG